MKYIFYILFIVIAFASCNVCNNGSGPSEYKPSDIYFSAKTINNNNSGIYGISSDASSLILISSSADLFTSPSSGYELSYSFPLTGNKTSVNLYDLKDSKDLSLSNTDIYGFDTKSVISNDGNYIAISTNKKLFLYNKSLNTTDFIAETVLENTLPVFSPNSEYLAYYLVSSAEEFELCVIYTSTMEIISKVKLNNIYRNFDIISSPVWDNISQKVFSIDYDDEVNNTLVSLEVLNNQLNKYDLPLSIQSFDISRNNKIAFTSRDGNIYLSDLNAGLSNFEKISKINIDEICLYPKFSSNEENILFTRYYLPNIDNFKGSLYNVNIKNKKMNYLFSNVTMGFWS